MFASAWNYVYCGETAKFIYKAVHLLCGLMHISFICTNPFSYCSATCVGLAQSSVDFWTPPRYLLPDAPETTGCLFWNYLRPLPSPQAEPTSKFVLLWCPRKRKEIGGIAIMDISPPKCVCLCPSSHSCIVWPCMALAQEWQSHQYVFVHTELCCSQWVSVQVQRLPLENNQQHYSFLIVSS